MSDISKSSRGERQLVLSSPLPRTLEQVFTPEALSRLRSDYRVLEVEPGDIAGLGAEVLGEIRYIVGQPALSVETLQALKNLKCIFNVESNLINNMPYDLVFERGIHVMTTGLVFAEPVAEMGIALALNLGRGIVTADEDFRLGRETWGIGSNLSARMLTGADVGIIGFGDLGRALNRLLQGFRTRVKVYDPWLPPSILTEHGVTPATLEEVVGESDFIFVMASVTSENRNFLGADDFARMRPGTAFILLSRADVVDFEAMMDAVRRGHILAASDVYPEEPLAADHAVRGLDNFIRSAHRAGGLPGALLRMGDMVLEDMHLLDRGLPPVRCKRAERETAARMRSKPVDAEAAKG